MMGQNSTTEKLVLGKVPDGHCSDGHSSVHQRKQTCKIFRISGKILFKIYLTPNTIIV